MDSDISFIKPPADIDIEYAFDFHLEKNASYPVFLHSDGPTSRRYNYAEVVPAIHRAGAIVSRSIGHQIGLSERAPVVAILAEINNMVYATVLLGLLRAGITVFPISPRFHPDIIAELLITVRPSHILVNDKLHDTANLALLELVKSSSHQIPSILQMPSHSDLYPQYQDFDPLPPHHNNFGKRVLILHSSSSTAKSPKVIEWTSAYVKSNSRTIDHSALDMRGKIFGCQSAEFFHGAGLCFLFWLPRSGYIMACLSPDSLVSVVPADSETVFRSYKESSVDFAWASPRFIESWSNNPEKLEYLSQLDCIIFGGSPLSNLAGNRLAARGIRMCSVYGATECGYISRFVAEPQIEDWEFFSLNPSIHVELRAIENGLYEALVVSERGLHEVALSNGDFQGKPAYCTGDLVVPHPTKSEYYKVIGRSQDQLLTSSGQVINPLAMENVLREYEQIQNVVVFGHGRPFLGLIVWPNMYEDDSSKEIWEIVEKCNKSFPIHSRFQKEMVLIADPSKPIQYGEKGLPKRALILHEYRDQIENSYMKSQTRMQENTLDAQ